MAVMFQVEGSRSSWPILIASGILALFIGTLFLLFPHQSLTVLISLAGLLSLVLGVILLAGAVKMALDGSQAFLTAFVPGFCLLVLGLVALLNPGLIGAFLAVVTGFAAILAGIGVAWGGLSSDAPPLRKILSYAASVLLVTIGLLVLLFPREGTVLATQMAGLLLAAGGVLLVASGIRGRPRRNPLENPEYRVIEEK